jgi:5'-nucleotidase
MRILVSNDDGIRAPGLWDVVRELTQIADISVVAPDREQSGVGTSVTFHHPLRVNEEPAPVSGVTAYSVEGTPADSIILALRLPLVTEAPDLIVSGFNEGANLGDDVFISGTVGAALQGYFYGLTSIAVSVDASKGAMFGPAATLTRLLVQNLMKKRLSERVLLNVNLPNVALGNIRDIRITRLAERRRVDRIQEGYDGRRRYYWIARGDSQWSGKEGTDQWALEQTMVSVTPLLANTTRPIWTRLKELVADVFTELRGS